MKGVAENNMTWNASLYDQRHSFVFKYGEDVVELLQPQAGERILDVGCGTGYLTNLIAERGATVKGIDSSASMIEKAKEEYKDLDFEVASVTNYEDKQPFDAVFSNAVLHWVKEKEAAASMMYRNLAPGGRLVLEMGGHGNVAQIIKALRSTLTLFGYSERAQFEQWYFPTLGEYSSLLESVGFRVLYAVHFDRETALKNTEYGIIDWLQMFGKNYLEGISENDVAVILNNVQTNLEPTHYREGTWYADYKRLRIVAIKQ